MAVAMAVAMAAAAAVADTWRAHRRRVAD